MSLRKLVHEILEATYNGRKIKVEAKILFVTDLKKITEILNGNFISYKLTIDDGEPIEKRGGFLGIYQLEGFILKGSNSEEKSRVVVTIDQGILTKYTLEIDNKKYELKQL